MSSDFSRQSPLSVRLTQLLELIQGNTKLTENFEEKWWPNFTATMNRDGYSPTVRMVPSFVAACLANESESEEPCDALKIARRAARH